MDIVIRKYDDDDYAAVNDIIKEAFDFQKSHCHDDNNLEYVALVDGVVAGYFILTKIRDVILDVNYIYVEYVCVKSEYQNMGVATKMMQYAIKEAQKMKASYMELTSNCKRLSAHHVYEKVGFIKRDTFVYRIYL